MPSAKKIIGITIGDPAGIGPEVVVKAIKSKELRKIFTPLLIGPRDIWNKYGASRSGLTIIDVAIKTNESRIEYGRPTGLCGEIAYKSLVTGIKFGISKVINALVTAPVSKQSLHLAGYGIKGHTEILSEKCGKKNNAMMMGLNKIFALLATRHIPLKKVSSVLKSHDIVRQASLCAVFLEEKVFKRKIRIALAAFNPHAGEDGLLGNEETDVIEPAAAMLKKRGFNCTGPVQSDVIYQDAMRGRYDLVVNMYHDQAMIPLKMINSRIIVNATLGLPFLRTSPGHGTGFDIAGKNAADPSSMIEALTFATRYAY